ncbi:DUF7351 domain-containing protein [Haloarcula onubensis]|uniref:ArsR family transcriptional regulator n=1 Tax=Haloarcula onubensis TaxID=2950539 RepID=A0ABU2FNF6_9EURY|nr:ArsR family transcriptional regulator [Halomicroarcula sp. S3CR25-11]MDS0281944.1 ArsR family transcriptional regulator [Halomicroarcula sp. S3CR25-11]
MSDRERSDISPEDAFGLVGHGLRIAILRELGGADERRLSFSTLRERVGERDSGKFNYHLSKLEGRFVAKTDSGGYALTYPGYRVVDAVHDGAFHQQAGVDREPVSGSCLDCGADLAFSYETIAGGRVACVDCEHRYLRHPFDPGGLVDREGAELGRAFDRVARANWRQAGADVCPVCSGRVDAWVRADAPEKAVAVRGHPTTVGFDCGQCNYHANVPPGAVLLDHPEVQGFCADNGVDVRARRLWELPFVVDPDAVSVRQDDPWELAVTVAPGDAERVAVLDETGTVTAFD